jgi:cell division septum initiation protein DivIVA
MADAKRFRREDIDRQRPQQFTTRFRGYDPGDVDYYVSATQAHVRRLQKRVDELEEWLTSAEEEAVHARFRVARADHQRALAEQRAVSAEANKRELEQTLRIAERTKRQVLVDAEERADSLFESAVRKARAEVVVEYRRMFEEANELDSLRLAVAAERVALDEVRSDIRARISAAAAELNRIADSDYFLGTSKAGNTEPGEPSPDMIRALRDMVNAQRVSVRPSVTN